MTAAEALERRVRAVEEVTITKMPHQRPAAAARKAVPHVPGQLRRNERPLRPPADHPAVPPERPDPTQLSPDYGKSESHVSAGE